MSNQEKKCIKLQQDYQKLAQAKSEFDAMFADVKKEKVTTDNINRIKPKVTVAVIKKQELKDKLREIQEQLDQKITGIHEGREIKISLNEQIEYWNQFYQDYDIKDEKGNLCQLPANLRLTPQALAEARRCIEQYGFDKILMIPAGISPQSLIDNQKFLIFDNPESDTNQNSDKYDPIYIGNKDKVKKSALWKDKTTQPQVIFLKNKNAVYTEMDAIIRKLQTDQPEFLSKKSTTRDYTYPDIIEMEQALELEGLDLVQAMILDRQYFDQTNRHLFDWEKQNITWLTKTKNKVKTGQCSGLFWSPTHRRWHVDLYGDSFCFDNLGSVFSRRLETTGEN